jgi:integrase/recombinase XerC
MGESVAGLPTELSVHSLRHSYISHLIEHGVDPLFVQQQVGHSWASTTAVYTSVGTDAKNRMLAAALHRVFDTDGATTTETTTETTGAAGTTW